MLYYPGDEHAPEDWYLTAREAIAYLGVEPKQFYAAIWNALSQISSARGEIYAVLSALGYGSRKAAGPGRRKKKMNNPITYQQSCQPLSFEQQELVERSINRTVEKVGEIIPLWPFHPEQYQQKYLKAKQGLEAALHQMIIWTSKDRIEDLEAYLLSEGWEVERTGGTRIARRPCTERTKAWTIRHTHDFLMWTSDTGMLDYEDRIIRTMSFLAAMEDTSAYAILQKIRAIVLQRQNQEGEEKR